MTSVCVTESTRSVSRTPDVATSSPTLIARFKSACTLTNTAIVCALQVSSLPDDLSERVDAVRTPPAACIVDYFTLTASHCFAVRETTLGHHVCHRLRQPVELVGGRHAPIQHKPRVLFSFHGYHHRQRRLYCWVSTFSADEKNHGEYSSCARSHPLQLTVQHLPTHRTTREFRSKTSEMNCSTIHQLEMLQLITLSPI